MSTYFSCFDGLCNAAEWGNKFSAKFNLQHLKKKAPHIWLSYWITYCLSPERSSFKSDWMAVLVSLCTAFLSALIAHQSMPHYPLVVDSVAINDVIKCSFMRSVECHLSGVALPCFRHNVGQSTTLQVLHDDPQLLLHQGRLKHLHHVPVLIVPHDDNLRPRTWTWEPWSLFMSSNIKGLLSKLA